MQCVHATTNLTISNHYAVRKNSTANVNITVTNKDTHLELQKQCSSCSMIQNRNGSGRTRFLHTINNYKHFQQFHLHDHSFAGLACNWLCLNDWSSIQLTNTTHYYILTGTHFYKHNTFHTNMMI